MHNAAGGTIQRLNPGLATVRPRSKIEPRIIGERGYPARRLFGAQSPAAVHDKYLFQFDGLILASPVQLSAPHLMRTLVLVRTESHRRA